MNTSLTAYTPLESLLLFQSLACYGVEANVFSRISDLLKKNPHITAAERFESGRLSPDALRNFFLQILKEEIKSERNQDAAGEGQNGEVKTPRKRKAPSPSLPTVQEAAQHKHLIPKLVPKLYATYRSSVTEQIREEERTYDRLQRDLQTIEQTALREQEKVNGTSPVPKTKLLPTTAPTDGVPQLTDGDKPRDDATIIPDDQGPQAAPDGNQTSPAVEDRQAPANPVLAQAPNATAHVQPPSGDQRLPIPPPNSGQVPSPSPFTRGPQTVPQLAQPPIAGFTASPTTSRRSPYPPQSNPPQPSGPAPPLSPNASRQGPPQSPVVLPPAAGVQYPPVQPVSPFTGNNVPQYGPTQYSPTHQRFPGPYPPPGPQSPGVQTPLQQRNYYGQYPGQPQYGPPPQQPPPMVQPPHQGGFMLPPFQVAPQDPSPARVQQAKAIQQTPGPSPNVRGPPPTVKTGKGGSPYHPLPPNPYAASPGPLATPGNFRTPQPPRLSLSTTPSSYTKWKPSTEKPSAEPIRSPSMSPITASFPDEAPLPRLSPPSKKAPRGRAKAKVETKSTKAKGKSKQKEPENAPTPQTMEESVPDAEATPTVKRGKQKKAPARQRLGSTTSSVVASSTRGRTRSVSIATEAASAADIESAANYPVKMEPRPSEDVIEEEEGTPPAPKTGTKRRRGNTTASRAQNKRQKIAERATSIPDSEEPPDELVLDHEIEPQPTTIVAPRHFSKMSVPIMNDIESHKHAAFFQQPVKEKVAEGYYDIIKRPQDLSSIKKAISAGAKVVANAASSSSIENAPGSPGGAGGNVMLPVSADAMPPKAIVNPAQLEKELIRIFANAVMFNQGDEDGVVRDAKEMYEAVQASVSNWRAAERSRLGGPRPEETVTPAPSVPPEEDPTPIEKDKEKEKGPGRRRKG